MKNLPPLFQLLLFYGSRTVAFGLWLFIVLDVFLVRGNITMDIWKDLLWWVILLVGGRTVVAEFFAKGKGNAAPPHPPEPGKSE